MRLKKLVTSVAVLGMAGGMVVAASGIAAATTLYPFVDWSSGANTGSTTLVGSTDPGNADSVLCLDFPAKGATGATPITSLSDTGHYSGRVNGTVVNPGTQLDEQIVLQDLLTQTPTCTGQAINFTASGSGAVTNAVKHQGDIVVTTTADVQSGIKAGSYTNIRVHCQTGQIVTAPSGGVASNQVAATTTGSATTCTSSTSSVDYKLKLVAIKIKSSLNLAACSDVDNVVDLTKADDDSVERTNEIDNSDAAHSYAPANAATKNVITIRECAQNTANVPGKPVSTTIKVTGAGTMSADVLFAQTTNPQTWDTTRGKSCSDAKETVTNTGTVAGVTGPLVQGARSFFCKGDYGIAIPFVISVRGADPANATIDPKGLLHPLPPQAVSGATVTIS